MADDNTPAFPIPDAKINDSDIASEALNVRRRINWSSVLMVAAAADCFLLAVIIIKVQIISFGYANEVNVIILIGQISTVMALLVLGNSYSKNQFLDIKVQLWLIARSCLIVSMMIPIYFFVCHAFGISLTAHSEKMCVATVVAAISSVPILSFFRAAQIAAVQTLIRLGKLREKIVVVGVTQTAAHFDKIIRSNERCEIVGYFDDRRPSRLTNEVHDLLSNYKGDYDDLLCFVRNNKIDRIVVAIPWSAHERLNNLIRKLRTVPIRIDLCPHPTIWTFPQLSVSRFSGVPLINAANGRLDHGHLLIKRAEDLILGSIIFLLLVPLFVVVSIMVKLESRGPAFFVQGRHGFNNKIFKIYKFRSMYRHSDEKVMQATRNDIRVTRIGKYLRKYSIDELPQLINVIIGNMSLVGPRPHPIPHNEEYATRIEEYFARHNVKPGITGWAQVHGFRGEIDDESAKNVN